MKRQLESNMESLVAFCIDNNISMEKTLMMPRCYSADEMYIQTYNADEAINGLKNNQPAEILIIIRKSPNGLDFELTEQGREVLAL